MRVSIATKNSIFEADQNLLFSKIDLERKSQKTIDREMKEEKQKQEWLKRELNPNILKEHKMPVEASSQSQDVDKNRNNSWIDRAFQRAKEQAERDNTTVEEVIKKRWGSLDKFKSLLSKSDEPFKETKEIREHKSNKEYHRDSRPSYSRTGWKTEARREHDKQQVSAENLKIQNAERRVPNPESPTKDINEEEKVEQKIQSEPSEAEKIMSEKEMNAIGAKIIKAELMGNLDKAKQLKEKLG